MSQSKPEATGKNLGTTVGDLAMHFRAKDESLREVYVNESDNETESMELTTMGGESNPTDIEDVLKEGDLLETDDKTPLIPESSERHSPGSSEYKKMFKNLNEFTEKITRTFEKISEIKSDLHTSRTRILSSKDNSSLSDSEDLSEGSRMSDRRSVHEDSPRKSPTHGEGVRGELGLVLNLEPGTELRQRKRTWSLDMTKLSEEPTLGVSKVGFSDAVEIESAIEADEHINEYDSDDDRDYFDANDYVKPGISPDDEPPKDSEIVKILRFASDPENKKMEGYAIIMMFCVIFLPMPSFIRGFLTCLLFVVFWHLVSEYMNNIVEPHSHLPRTPFTRPDYSKLPPLMVPVIPQADGVWFNEYTFPYNPDWYSVSHTFPVYMEIEKSFLKLSRPKGKINKRATFDERKYKLDFINKRVFDLRHCRISLRPEGILRRRYFSKKYPIFIELMPGAFVKAVKFRESTSEEEEIELDSVFKIQDAVGIKSNYGKEYLNLFARCNRQKEEWFRRLQSASKAQHFEEESDEPSTPFESVTFDSQAANYDEYWEYMSKFVMKSSNSADDEVDEGIVKAEQEVQWLSAFVNRILFDVFRTPYWLDKIQSKIQRKLASIRLPYYIEAVEIIEMDLGKVGPRFHRISTPVLDERGLWFDVDLSFDGSFKMTLQTQLNLVKLQKGLEDEVAKLPDDKQDDRSVEENVPKRHKRLRQTRSEVIKVSSRELLLEFAEMVVRDVSVPTTERSSVNTTDGEQSDSTESDEDDDDDDDNSNDAASKSIMLDPNRSESKRPAMRRSSKKIFRVMESVAQSKYFKTIAETKYIQKAIAGVSATKLRLVLEIKSCVGTLAINLPPPPLDRVWFGFRNMPKIWMSAQPMVGQKNFGFSQIRHFVERKIMDEIKKIIVMPNMDDLILPVPPKEYRLKMQQEIDAEPEKS